MDCGLGVPLCGTLALQSGLGKGVYHHKMASVHGLWPETGDYGTSKCTSPLNSTGPSKIYDCYSIEGGGDDHTLWFENHEWTKHGVCAGVKDVDDFFSQVCALAKSPVEVLEIARKAGEGFDTMAEALKSNGYPVWSVDEMHDQVMLSACAGSDGRWVLSTLQDMPSKCGGPSPSPGPPGPAPQPGSCSPGRKGPPCSGDSTCSGLDGCIRCAHSGYCTSVPILDTSDDRIPMVLVV